MIKDNRQALWSSPSNGGVGSMDYPTDKRTYQTIKRLNQIRSFLASTTAFDTEKSHSITPGSATEAALKRGNSVYVITNVSPLVAL